VSYHTLHCNNIRVQKNNNPEGNEAKEKHKEFDRRSEVDQK
jgi:hypothetical protein